jgi:PKD repeat protein
MRTVKKIFVLLILAGLAANCSKDNSSDSPTPPAVSNPIADFASNTTTIRAGTSVQFVNGSTNATSFEWSFPGGTPETSTEVEPFIKYNTAGTYSVSLKAINAEGTNTLNKENFINVVEATAETAVYTVTFTGNWNSMNHPTDFPANDHFSAAIGAVHTADINLFEEGMPASTGIKDMAEQGNNTALSAEIDALITDGDALNSIDGGGLSSGTETATFEVTVSSDFGLVSIVSMIAPSPDWFIGISDVALYENGAFLDNLTVEAAAYDAGTDSGSTFTSANEVTDPAEAISLITQSPLGDGNTVSPSLASFTFVKQ